MTWGLPQQRARTRISLSIDELQKRTSLRIIPRQIRDAEVDGIKILFYSDR